MNSWDKTVGEHRARLITLYNRRPKYIVGMAFTGAVNTQRIIIIMVSRLNASKPRAFAWALFSSSFLTLLLRYRRRNEHYCNNKTLQRTDCIMTCYFVVVAVVVLLYNGITTIALLL